MIVSKYMRLFLTLSMCKNQQSTTLCIMCHYSKCCITKCSILCNVNLNVIKQMYAKVHHD